MLIENLSVWMMDEAPVLSKHRLLERIWLDAADHEVVKRACRLIIDKLIFSSGTSTLLDVIRQQAEMTAKPEETLNACLVFKDVMSVFTFEIVAEIRQLFNRILEVVRRSSDEFDAVIEVNLKVALLLVKTASLIHGSDPFKGII